LVACEEAGHAPVTSIFVTGGLVKNPLYLQAHADVAGCVLELPRESEPVLLGAAVLGARAGEAFGTLQSAMGVMNRVGSRVLPFQLDCGDECDMSVPSNHACKYAMFRKMPTTSLRTAGSWKAPCLTKPADLPSF
jgi:ribulose kinase